jgi:hypothetical protein
MSTAITTNVTKTSCPDVFCSDIFESFLDAAVINAKMFFLRSGNVDIFQINHVQNGTAEFSVQLMKKLYRFFIDLFNDMVC